MDCHIRIMWTLGRFHSWAERRVLGRMSWCWNGFWEYPLIGEDLAEAKMELIGEYIS